MRLSSGERALLHLSMDISQRKSALILIDEIEPGLHPQTQLRLMLELQRIALRNELQIVVTTHSPTVLSSVPEDARLFLERNEDGVKLVRPYRDLVQKALYGESRDSLSILCEDRIAEHVLRGVFDYLNPILDLRAKDIRIGRATGSSEFLAHYRAIARSNFNNFNIARDFIFIFDGDASQDEQRFIEETRNHPPLGILHLPGQDSPESWIWEQLKTYTEEYYEKLNFASKEKMYAILDEKEKLYATAADTPANKAKNRLESLAEHVGLESERIARMVGQQEAIQKRGDLPRLMDALEDKIRSWRSCYN